MQLDNINDIRSGLIEKAKAGKFLERSVNDIESEANRFVEEFAGENGLTAHTLSAYRWYFQSDDKLLEDGFIELHCKTNFFKHEGFCTFEIVDVAEIDEVRHLSKP
ncbi:MAG: hypothetical protein ACI9N9_001960 [Enterobacterales bacterium]|jgi:hypothetical protein